jgi:FtsH-binding integral membrane protein
MLAVTPKEVNTVPTEMPTKEEIRAPQLQLSLAPSDEGDAYEPARGAAQRRALTWNDLGGTVVAAVAVLVYVANVQDWWYLGSNRWAAVTMLAVGLVGCQLGARLAGEKPTSLPIMLLAVLGAGALTLAILAIVTAAQWALLALAILVVALWAGTTLRHAATPAPRSA